MKSGNNALANAIRNTRSRLGETQTTFAQTLGVAVATLARYEIASQQPKAPILKRLIDLAAQERFTDLERVFRLALSERAERKRRDLGELNLNEILAHRDEEAIAAFEAELQSSLSRNPKSRVIADAIKGLEEMTSRHRKEIEEAVENYRRMLRKQKRTDK